MKIHVEQFGVIHYVADCENCDFNLGFRTEETYSRQDVRKATTKHIRETGHSVTVESGTSSRYSPIIKGKIK